MLDACRGKGVADAARFCEETRKDKLRIEDLEGEGEQEAKRHCANGQGKDRTPENCEKASSG